MNKTNKHKEHTGGLNLLKQIRSVVKQIDALVRNDKYLNNALLNAYQIEIADLKSNKELLGFYQGVKEMLESSKGKGKVTVFKILK